MAPVAAAGARKLLERFTCAICLDVQEIRSLRELTCCSSLLCEACSDEHFGRRKAACPCCRKKKPGDPRPLPTLYGRLADDVAVTCDEPGCDWAGSLNDYFGDHTRRCSVMAAPCRYGCGELLLVAERAAHERACERNVTPCDICGEPLRPGEAAEHDVEAAPRHVEALRARLSEATAREATAAASAAAAASELAELRALTRQTAADLEALKSTVEVAAARRFAWALAPPGAAERARLETELREANATAAPAEDDEDPDADEDQDVGAGGEGGDGAAARDWAFETQAWCTEAGVSLWLRLTMSQDGREAEARLHADGPLLLQQAAVAVSSSPGSGWRASESPDADLVIAEPSPPRLDAEEDAEGDEQENAVRSTRPLASWRLPAAAVSNDIPRCVVDVRARSLLLL